MRLGIIGLGEAGSAIAAGAAEAGAVVFGYDRMPDDPPAAGHFAALRSSGVRVVNTLEDLVDAAAVIICLVPPTAALSVARQAAPLLRVDHTYVDANSVSPAAVEEMADYVTAVGAGFVDAAVMAPVPPSRQKVPMLMSGRPAADLTEKLRAFGFDADAVGTSPGTASAAKMVRSVIVKGTEALLIEALTAATAYNVADAVLESLDRSFPRGSWRSKADYFAGRTARHGRRRADELVEAAAALEAVGVEPLITSAAAVQLGRAGRLSDGRKSDDSGYAGLVALIANEQRDDAG